MIEEEPPVSSALQDWIAGNFDCREGLPRAWIEVDPTGELMPPDGEMPEMQASGERLMYRMVGFAGDCDWERLAQLIREFLTPYIGDGSRKLYWRRRPMWSAERDMPGDRVIRKVTMRMGIFGAGFSGNFGECEPIPRAQEI